MRFLTLFLASSLLICASHAVTYDGLRGVSYDNPAQWQEKTQERARILMAPSSKSGEFLAIILSPAVKASGKPLSDELDTFVALAQKKLRPISHGEAIIKHAGRITIATMATQVEDPKMGVHNRIYELVTDGKYDAFAIVISKGDDTLKANQETLQKILLSYRPTSVSEDHSETAHVGTDPAEGSRTGRIPYADAPGKTPPDPEFRPSGKGRVIPTAALVDGKPQGLWWTYTQTGSPTAYGTVFFPDGMALHYYRPGGPNLADLEGMKANQGAYNIGSWSLEDGEIGTHFGELIRKAKFSTGEDSDGKFFKGGTQVYRPATQLNAKSLTGTWEIPGIGSFNFRSDGTVQTTVGMIGSIRPIGSYDSTARTTGTWFIDGYLLVLKFPIEGYRVFPTFKVSGNSIAISSYFYFRK